MKHSCGWPHTKRLQVRPHKAVRTGAVGKSGKLNKAVNKNYPRGSDMNVSDAGIKDKETQDYIDSTGAYASSKILTKQKQKTWELKHPSQSRNC